MAHVSYTELRQNLSRYLDETVEARVPLVVTRPGGKGNVVMISEEEFNGWQETVHRFGDKSDLQTDELIEDVRRHPFQGIGKPEALKGDLSGWWSRRITAEHRLVYRVQGRKGEDQRVELIQCRYHY